MIAATVGDIVRAKDCHAHYGRVSATFPERDVVQVRWGQTRWVGEIGAGLVETVICEHTVFARMKDNHR